MTTYAARARVLRRPSSVRTGRLLRSVIALGVFVVIVMWWTGGPGPFLTTPGATVTSFGELSGMVGGFLVCIQVLLIARVPWMERAIGMDHLVAWHRTLGATVLFLIVTHVVAMIFGQQLIAAQAPWTATFAVLTTYPDILTALIGTLLFFAIGISSARIPRQKLSYEIWYWLHTTAYVAVFLTFLHQISAGVHFDANPLNRTAWIALYLGTASAVLTWRIILPALAAWRHRLRVLRVVNEGAGIISVWLAGKRLHELGAVAGQFFLFRFLTRGHLLTAHPFSLSRAPDGEVLRISVGALGDHTSQFRHLKPGTLVFAEGPFGIFTAARSTRGKILLVAGGAGVGPIRALAEDFVRHGLDVVVVYRSTRPNGLALEHELRALNPITLHTVVGSRRELGHDPLDAKALRRLVRDIREREVYICGPTGMAITVEASVLSLGVPPQMIHREELSMA
jgi:predicted ferric reductase